MEDKVQLLPEYIFFQTESDVPLSRLPRITNVLSLLEDDKLNCELIGCDRGFAEFLLEIDGLVFGIGYDEYV